MALDYSFFGASHYEVLEFHLQGTQVLGIQEFIPIKTDTHFISWLLLALRFGSPMMMELLRETIVGQEEAYYATILVALVLLSRTFTCNTNYVNMG